MTMKEELQLLDEMPGANMNTRDVHQYLKKRGWRLSRSSGGHDVFTHDESSHHIAVPRHNQLKAPLVRGILKLANIHESKEEQLDELKRSTLASHVKKVGEFEKKVHATADGMSAEKRDMTFSKLNKHLKGRIRATAKIYHGHANEEVELDEITLGDYKQKAKQQIADLKPHAKKGEYKDLAKNLIARRQAGLDRAATRNEEMDLTEGRVMASKGKVTVHDVGDADDSGFFSVDVKHKGRTIASGYYHPHADAIFIHHGQEGDKPYNSAADVAKHFSGRMHEEVELDEDKGIDELRTVSSKQGKVTISSLPVSFPQKRMPGFEKVLNKDGAATGNAPKTDSRNESFEEDMTYVDAGLKGITDYLKKTKE